MSENFRITLIAVAAAIALLVFTDVRAGSEYTFPAEELIMVYPHEELVLPDGVVILEHEVCVYEDYEGRVHGYAVFGEEKCVNKHK